MLSITVSCADNGDTVPAAELGVCPHASANENVVLVPACVRVFGTPAYVYCTFQMYQMIEFGPSVYDVDAS